MFTIGEIHVEEEVAGVRFACNLSACKGACCTLEGGRGAPVTDLEVEEMRKALPAVEKYLPAAHREVIARKGVVDGFEGNYATHCYRDRACVFVYYEGGIAKCAFERAFLNGEIEWRKPLSCHLFPIRSSNGLMKKLRYEEISECAPAVVRGGTERIPLYRFLKDALVRAYGEAWYDDFARTCDERGTATDSQG